MGILQTAVKMEDDRLCGRWVEVCGRSCWLPFACQVPVADFSPGALLRETALERLNHEIVIVRGYVDWKIEFGHDSVRLAWVAKVGRAFARKLFNDSILRRHWPALYCDILCHAA